MINEDRVVIPAARLTVIPPLANVLIDNKIEAKVQSIGIRPEWQVYYFVDWWSGDDHREEWFHSARVTPVDTSAQKTVIGFRST